MTVNIVTGSMLKGLHEAGCRNTTICKCKGYGKLKKSFGLKKDFFRLFCLYFFSNFCAKWYVFSELVTYTLEKWFPLRGERAHSLKLFCMYDKRFEI